MRGLDAGRASAKLWCIGECRSYSPRVYPKSQSYPDETGAGSENGHVFVRTKAQSCCQKLSQQSAIYPRRISAGSSKYTRWIQRAAAADQTRIKSSTEFSSEARLRWSTDGIDSIPIQYRLWSLIGSCFCQGGNDRAKRQHAVCGRSRPDSACILSWPDPVLDPITYGYER